MPVTWLNTIEDSILYKQREAQRSCPTSHTYPFRIVLGCLRPCPVVLCLRTLWCTVVQTCDGATRSLLDLKFHVAITDLVMVSEIFVE